MMQQAATTQSADVVAPMSAAERAQLEALKAQVEALQNRPSQSLIELDSRRLEYQKKQETLAGVAAFALLIPLVVAMSIRILRRGRRPEAPAGLEADRLARLEQAVDAIAFEVERIGEAQRFQTRLMSEKAPAGELR